MIVSQHFSASGHVSHICLSDGGVLRLDLEVGRWRARWYSPALVLVAYAWGPYDQMLDIVNHWADVFEASLTSPLAGVGDGRVQTGDFPAPGQTNLPLGETA